MNSIEFEKPKWTLDNVPLLYSKSNILKQNLNIDTANKKASEFIFSERGRELNSIINDNRGQMSANALLREVFLAGYIQGKQL